MGEEGKKDTRGGSRGKKIGRSQVLDSSGAAKALRSYSKKQGIKRSKGKKEGPSA